MPKLAKPTSTPEFTAAPVATEQTPPQLYAPLDGLRLRGEHYQSGEPLPADLTKEEIGEAQAGGAHGDYSKAEKDFRKKPALTAGERAGNKKKGRAPKSAPEVGKPQTPEYADEPISAPPANPLKSLGKTGRHFLPPELADPAWDLLTDEEANKINAKAAKKLVEVFNQDRPDAEYIAAAQGGRAKRGWYRQAAQAIRILFGSEAPRFASLLAATSPRVPVKVNLRKTLLIWQAYQEEMTKRAEAGNHQPMTEQQAIRMLHRLINRLNASGATQSAKLFQQLRGSHWNNILTSLTHEDPGQLAYGVLKGPKVDSFRRNLLGDLSAITHDVWMARLGRYNQKDISSLGATYLAHNAKIRRVAKKLNMQLQPGEEPWQPAEVQETAWSFIRALGAYGGQSRSPGHVPANPLEAVDRVTHEWVKNNADFVTLLARDPYAREKIHQLGLNQPFAALLLVSQKEKEARAPLTGRAVPDDLSGPERSAANAVGRTAGEYVAGFMGKQGLERYQRQSQPLRYAAPFRREDGSVPAPPAPNSNPREESLDFGSAYTRSRSGNVKALRKTVQSVLQEMGLQGKAYEALSDDDQETDPTVLQVIQHPADPNLLRYAGAWYGLLGNQKGVLVFHPGRDGRDSVYSIDVPDTNAAQVRTDLQSHGIPFRTLVPRKSSVRVVIYDQGRALRDQVAQFAGRYHAPVRESTGSGDILGGDSHASARSQYRRIITDYESATPGQQSGSGTSRSPVRPQPQTVQPDHGSQEAGPESSRQLQRRGLRARYAADMWDPAYHEYPDPQEQPYQLPPPEYSQERFRHNLQVHAPHTREMLQALAHRLSPFSLHPNSPPYMLNPYFHQLAQRFLAGDWSAREPLEQLLYNIGDEEGHGLLHHHGEELHALGWPNASNPWIHGGGAFHTVPVGSHDTISTVGAGQLQRHQASRNEIRQYYEPYLQELGQGPAAPPLGQRIRRLLGSFNPFRRKKTNAQNQGPSRRRSGPGSVLSGGQVDSGGGTGTL